MAKGKARPRLMPCPFCRADVRIVTVTPTNQVVCVKCHMRGPMFADYDHAITAWNSLVGER